MISAFLFPPQRSEEMSTAALSMYRMLRAEPATAPAGESTLYSESGP